VHDVVHRRLRLRAYKIQLVQKLMTNLSATHSRWKCYRC
jgi:hypothetical protein